MTNGDEKRARGEPVWWLRTLPAMLAAGGLLLLAAAALVLGRRNPGALDIRVDLGRFTFVISGAVPARILTVSAALTLLGLVLLVVGSNLLAARRAARLLGRNRGSALPLRREVTRKRQAGPLRVVVLIPAHNEEQRLPAALSSLAAQTRPPDLIWVIADNCTDDTALVAERAGAQVFPTVGNQDKKAGALNQLLGRLLPAAGPFDTFLVMDADTMLDAPFLQVAVERLEADPTMDAVGGVFFGESGSGLVRQLQRSEYVRYGRDISRRQARVFVLSGTASLFRADTMRAVAAARGGALPGTPGHVYDTIALTEDNELTIALKSLGADLISPQQCRVQTELMPTWGDLWRQRQRWQRGALENIGTYGITSATSRYWIQQSAIGYGTVALSAFILLMVITLLCGVLAFFPFWAAVGGIFWLERVTTVWRAGWKARGLAALLFVELGYDMFLQAVYVKSLVDIATGQAREWNHVADSQPAEAA